MPFRILILLGVLASLPADTDAAHRSLGQQWGDLARGRVAHETDIALYGGMAYDWSELGFGLLSFSHRYDYEDVWLHTAPDGLGIRLEAAFGAAGGTEFPGARLMTSGGFLASYEFPESETLPGHFYAEAGVGLIYTDFQRPDQSLRLNFNPVAGIGWRGSRQFVTLRLSHISNGGLKEPNRGINSVVVGIGTTFK